MKEILKANYHTHTKRCYHASGEDREYVEAAIESGLKILGFSDHTPYPVSPYFESGMRMGLKDADDYFHSIVRLREEYKKDIEISIGVEAEYFPEHFFRLLEFMKDYPLDYMILGEHFIPDEQHGKYVGGAFTDKSLLDLYVKNVIEGMKTGKFLYVAHPDLPNYVGKDKEIHLQHAMDEICKEAKQLQIPLEINVLGYMRQIQYPSAYLFQAAKKYENDVIVGMDVHDPKNFFCRQEVEDCIKIIKEHGLRRIETIECHNLVTERRNYAN